MVYSFPEGYDTATCYLVPINAALIPLVAGALKPFEHRRTWSSDEDYERGYNAIVELESIMTRLCIEQLIESNDRLYRMLDTAIYGTAYSVVSTDPLDVVPAIAPTHDLAIAHIDSLLGRGERITQLLENALNGTETVLYDAPLGVRELLAQLITAVQETGQLDDEQLAQLVQIAGLLA